MLCYTKKAKNIQKRAIEECNYVFFFFFFFSLQSSVSNYKPAAGVTSFNNYFDLILSTTLSLDSQFPNSDHLCNSIAIRLSNINYVQLFSSQKKYFHNNSLEVQFHFFQEKLGFQGKGGKKMFICHNLPSQQCLYSFVFYRHISTVKSKHFVFQVYKKSCGQWKWKVQLDDLVLG